MKREQDIFLLSLLGPLSLLLGLLCALLKYAQPLWPLIAAISLGFFLIWKWKKPGFFFSFVFLVFALFGVFRTQEVFWPSLLSLSASLSWLLLFLGHQEMRLQIAGREERTAALQEDNTALLSDLQCLEAMTSRDQKEMAAAIERLKSELHAQIEQEKKEKENWQEEISSYQRKEKAFQHALEDAQSQLLKYKYEMAKEPSPIVVPQEDPIEEKSSQILQAQYTLLKEQFEEKSEVLHQTRKELFSLESQWLALQKQIEEEGCSFDGEDDAALRYFQKIQEEHQDLEAQVLALQDLVSVLLQPKKNGAPRKRKNAKEAQEDLFLMIQEKKST